MDTATPANRGSHAADQAGAEPGEQAALLVSDLLDRVLTTTATVGFTAADSNGHLATGRYLDAFVDHRFEAFTRELGLDWYRVAREQNVAYVLGEITLRLRRPVFAGWPLTVSSWVSAIKGRNITVGALFLAADRTVHAAMRAAMIPVDTRTGRPTDHPAVYARPGAPSLETLPLASEMLKSVSGLPEGFFSQENAR